MSARLLQPAPVEAEPPVARLDPAVERLLRRIRLRSRCRAEWLRALWALEGDAAVRGVISDAESDALIEDRDSPAAEAEWISASPVLAGVRSELARLEREIAEDRASRWALLCRIFGLSAVDADLLSSCLAAHLDPGIARLFAYLQDDPGRHQVTRHLVRRLFGHGTVLLAHSESPLLLWDLVREHQAPPGEPAAFTIDPQVCDWILGESTLDPLLVGVAALREAQPSLDAWPVEPTLRQLRGLLDGQPGRRVRLVISGPAGSGRTSLGAALAARLGMGLLAIDADLVEPERRGASYVHAQRQAYLDQTAPCWRGECLATWSWPRQLLPYPLQIAIVESGQTLSPHPDLVDRRVELSPLEIDDRLDLWRRLLPASVAWPEGELEHLAADYQVTPADIAAAAALGAGSPAEVAATVRERARCGLGDLAQRLECPFVWDDLVVPERTGEMLRDFLFEARDRALFWERPERRRLFPQGRGLMALFSGPSGTGKTMSAQVIAAELGRDLFRIDLAAVVSKYVGETSRNLERVLSRARHLDLVLLFDEADALLGKRTEIKDAHDRFANTDTNYLLQALEDYPGIAILSTNRQANIDAAFMRRLRYLVEYPRPDAAQRLRLWRRLVEALAGEQAGSGLAATIERLAASVDLTGAQIKYALLSALFAARRGGEELGQQHLFRGIDRELAKEGRALSDRERGRILGRGR